LVKGSKKNPRKKGGTDSSNGNGKKGKQTGIIRQGYWEGSDKGRKGKKRRRGQGLTGQAGELEQTFKFKMERGGKSGGMGKRKGDTLLEAGEDTQIKENLGKKTV